MAQGEADRIAADVHRRLMPGGDVRRRGVVERVDAAQQPQVEGCEFVALGIRQTGEVGHVTVRQDVQLDRPAGGEWHERREVLAPQDDARPRSTRARDVAVVGFDDVADAADYRPPLTTLRTPQDVTNSAADPVVGCGVRVILRSTCPSVAGIPGPP